MEVYHNLSELPFFENAVITIGSFDGVHIGHQKLFERINTLAKENNGKSIVITFHPHPRIVLRPDDSSIKLITSIDEKVKLIEQYGIDVLVVVPFNKDFLNQNPDEYIQQFLIKKFNPKFIVIGYDHKFGKNRAGDIEYLKRYQLSAGFKVIEIEKQEIKNITISSSKIRKALGIGDIKKANHLLGHPFTLSGTVVRGEGIGHQLGYPTANIELSTKYKIIPLEGIYAIKVHYLEKVYNGVLYIGNRPTLEEYNSMRIEAHIFNFNKDLYGDKLKLEFVELIRGDQKFEGLDLLKKQMAIDAQRAREILKTEQSINEENVITEWPEVAVAILNYNGKDWLEKFMPSVYQTDYPNKRLVIIDNGSTDNSLEFLNAHYPEVEIIKLYQNFGFAKGYNEGLKQVDSPYLVLLNSDVEVEPGWLQPIIALMEKDDKIAVCQPKVRYQRDKAYFEYSGAAGGMIDKWGYPFCKGRILNTLEKDEGQYDRASECFWASGAAFVIQNKLYTQVGGLDEDYFAHHEEIDLCWRLKRAGYKIMSQPAAVVYHYGGGTLDYLNSRKVFFNFRNSLYNIIKNEPMSKVYWLVLLRLILDGVAGIVFLMKGQTRSMFAIIRAHFSMYKNYRKMLRKRAHYNDLIQKTSVSTLPNKTGIFNKSIIWQYYVRGKKYYKDL